MKSTAKTPLLGANREREKRERKIEETKHQWEEKRLKDLEKKLEELKKFITYPAIHHLTFGWTFKNFLGKQLKPDVYINQDAERILSAIKTIKTLHGKKDANAAFLRNHSLLDTIERYNKAAKASDFLNADERNNLVARINLALKDLGIESPEPNSSPTFRKGGDVKS